MDDLKHLYYGPAFGRGEDFECAQVRKGCRWLPSTQYGEPCNERKGTVVHPMHSKGLH